MVEDERQQNLQDYKRATARQRSKHWADRIRASTANGKAAAFQWVKASHREVTTYLKEPGSGKPVAGLSRMLEMLREEWGPSLARYRHGAAPVWETLKREYEDDLPSFVPCREPELTDEDAAAFLRRRGPRKGSGLHGWTTREAKALPASVVALFARTLRAAMRSGRWPRALYYAPSPMP